jgi:hypothetical protein
MEKYITSDNSASSEKCWGSAIFLFNWFYPFWGNEYNYLILNIYFLDMGMILI